MKTVSVSSTYSFPIRLEREIREDPQLGPMAHGLTAFENITEFYFSDTFDSADETYFRFTFLLNFVDEDNTWEKTPKIFSMTYVQKQDVREIDYRVELHEDLFPKRTFLRGELQKVYWCRDLACTDEVLKVEMAYTRDSFGFPLTRTTTRTWINNDESDHPDKKVTTKVYYNSPLAMIEEGLRRRGNIVNTVQLPTFAFMKEALMAAPHNLPETTVLFMGRDFMDRFEDEFDNFRKSSSTVTDPQDPNFGRKVVVVALEIAANGDSGATPDPIPATDPWLNEKPATLGGASILQYLSNEFVDES